MSRVYRETGVEITEGQKAYLKALMENKSDCMGEIRVLEKCDCCHPLKEYQEEKTYSIEIETIERLTNVALELGWLRVEGESLVLDLPERYDEGELE